MIWTPNRELPVEVDQLWPEQLTPTPPLRLFSGPKIPEILADAIRSGRPVCAHNASNFDALVWRALDLPEPHLWIDTLPLVRAADFRWPPRARATIVQHRQV